MVRKTLIAVAAVAALFCLSSSASAQTVDEIIQKNLAAKGGIEKLKSIDSLRSTGTMVAQGQTVTMTVTSKRPNKTRQEIVMGAQTEVCVDTTCRRAFGLGFDVTLVSDGHSTWDNATLLCEAADARSGSVFPLTLKMQRIAPGQRNHWYVEILGTRASARWSSVRADILQVLEYAGGEQVGGEIQTGHETAFKTITGGIIQFGFTDSILQMWAAFLYEVSNRKPLKRFAACVTPADALLSHKLFTAALTSQKNQSVEVVK